MQWSIVETWIECLGCGYIYVGKGLAKYFGDDLPDDTEPQLPDQPCPQCGGDVHESWDLPDSLNDWLITVDETVTSNEIDRQRIGAVFAASGCEAMLADIVDFVLEKQGVSLDLRTYLILGARGREKLCDLYRAAFARPIPDVLREASLAHWYQAWDKLAKVRNRFAHGRDSELDVAGEIRIVTKSLESVFVALRNAALTTSGLAKLSAKSPRE